MLESIAINRRVHPNLKQPFTTGHLAECLLFYGQVNAVISPSEFEELVRKCSIDNLRYLLASEALKLHIRLASFGSNQTPGTLRLNYAVYTQVGLTLESIIYQTLYKIYHNSYKCNVYVKQLMPFLDLFEHEYSLIDGFLQMPEFTTKAFREIVSQVIPNYPIPLNLFFRLHEVPKGNAPEELGTKFTFESETNFNLQQFKTDLLSQGITGHSDFGVTFLMRASDAIEDVDVSSRFKSELSADDSNSPIVQKAILDLDQYKPNNQEAITQFNEHVITDCPSVADAIDQGMRSFDEFIPLFKESRKFRHWIHSIPDDEDYRSIVNEYMKENNAKVFTDGVFYKVLKFLSVTAPVAITPIVLPKQPEIGNAVVNLAVGTAMDSFADVAFSQFNGWKPNQFVQKDLVPFLNP
ncbi:hypothetical protein [Spirosoma pollinicola]|uniref:Uncharacterized protein n=1 Tax=Spirosoma pollinicola TaxID=2057025 RepID=A0A2K8Z9D3_9BACT|nr:hypothetical protein [Spirosoma pollinicola]AUD06478.1 hypothetical protein CWM47_34325 [Spirosoma pollinicola]